MPHNLYLFERYSLINKCSDIYDNIDINIDLIGHKYYFYFLTLLTLKKWPQHWHCFSASVKQRRNVLQTLQEPAVLHFYLCHIPQEIPHGQISSLPAHKQQQNVNKRWLLLSTWFYLSVWYDMLIKMLMRIYCEFLVWSDILWQIW